MAAAPEHHLPTAPLMEALDLRRAPGSGAIVTARRAAHLDPQKALTYE